jgi:hypothetical protein
MDMPFYRLGYALWRFFVLRPLCHLLGHEWHDVSNEKWGKARYCWRCERIEAEMVEHPAKYDPHTLFCLRLWGGLYYMTTRPFAISLNEAGRGPGFFWRPSWGTCLIFLCLSPKAHVLYIRGGRVRLLSKEEVFFKGRRP